MAEPYERIDDNPRFDGKVRDEHELRYRIAAQFVPSGKRVLDACCGSGYGRAILEERGHVRYIGCDRTPPEGDGFFFADFENGNGMGDDGHRIPNFHVFVGLECIEHLHDVGVQRFVKVAKRAMERIVISTPIVANSNKFHKQQFRQQEIVELFEDTTWRLEHYLEQDRVYGIFIFTCL